MLRLQKTTLQISTLYICCVVLPTVAIRSLVSVPASDGGVLTAGVGQQISLTCSHDGIPHTVWKISTPIDCTGSLIHDIGIGGKDDCGPFSFRKVSPDNYLPPYTSTAIANANTSMTGAVVQCLNGAVQVGSNITLCVYDPVSGVSSSNNSEISWNAVIDSPACVNQVEYMVTITNIRNVSDNQIDVSDVFQRGESYNVSVCSKAVGGSCSAEPATILCEISLTPPTPTTSTAVLPTNTDTSNIVQKTELDTTTAVVITFVVTTVIMLIVGVVFGSFATFLIMKKRKSTPEHHSPTDGASGGPFYEQVSPSNATSKEEVEMDKNVAYGHGYVQWRR